jgi:hypothetical protein
VLFCKAGEISTKNEAHLLGTQLPLLKLPKKQLTVEFLRKATKYGIQSPAPIKLVVQHFQFLAQRNCSMKDLQPVLEHLNTNAAEHTEVIKEVLMGCKCFKMDDSNYVSVDQLFFDISDDLKPFFYRVPRNLVSFDNFLKAAGVEEFPTVAHFQKFLQAMKEKYVNKRVTPNEVIICTKLLFKIAEMNEVPESLPVLTDKYSLVPREEAVFLDVRYLNNRVDIAKLSVIHPAIVSIARYV